MSNLVFSERHKQNTKNVSNTENIGAFIGYRHEIYVDTHSMGGARLTQYFKDGRPCETINLIYKDEIQSLINILALRLRSLEGKL